jgi:hypothetical protein
MYKAVNLRSCLVWVCNLVLHPEERTSDIDDWK